MTAIAIFTLVILAVSALYFSLVVALTMGMLHLEERRSSPGTFTTLVTVIIPARNEEENIGNLLEGLSKQDYPAGLFNLILADDQSEDKTLEKAKKFCESHPSFSLKIIKAEKKENGISSKKEIIEKAVSIATGDLIITTDADVVHSPGWIRSFVDLYEKEKPAMILGPVACSGEKGWIEDFQSLELAGLMSVTAGSCRLGSPLMCNGANLAFERKAFMECGGFEGNRRFVSGDDMFLLMKFLKKSGRKRVKFLLSRDAVVLTRPRSTLAEFFSQRFRWVSKSRGYTDLRIVTTAVITYVFNLALLCGLVAGIWIRPLLWIIPVLMIARMLFEGPMVMIMAKFLGKERLMAWFPLADIFYMPYVVITGLLGMILPYRWKGRVVRRGGFVKEGPPQQPGPQAS